MIDNKLTKYIVIPYIAFGLVISLTIGIEHNCVRQELFPTYYGSPFVFKEKSLGSSMEYYYSISGLLLNMIIWNVSLFFVRFVVLKLIAKLDYNKIIKVIHKGLVVVLIAFTTLNILVDSVMIGHGFRKGLNYWYMDLNKEAKDRGMECKGELIIFGK